MVRGAKQKVAQLFSQRPLLHMGGGLLTWGSVTRWPLAIPDICPFYTQFETKNFHSFFLHNQQLWWLWQISGMPPAREKQPLQVYKTRQDKAEATQGNARQSKAEQRQRREILSISDADWTQFQQTVKRPHCLILTQEIVGSKARRLRFLLMHWDWNVTFLWHCEYLIL